MQTYRLFPSVHESVLYYNNINIEVDRHRAYVIVYCVNIIFKKDPGPTANSELHVCILINENDICPGTTLISYLIYSLITQALVDINCVLSILLFLVALINLYNVYSVNKLQGWHIVSNREKPRHCKKKRT